MKIDSNLDIKHNEKIIINKIKEFDLNMNLIPSENTQLYGMSK